MIPSNEISAAVSGVAGGRSHLCPAPTVRRVLGVDPGTYRMGLGVVEREGSAYRAVHFETVELRRGELAGRLHELFDRLTEVIKIYRPQAMAVENVFYSENVQTAIKIGEARALALLAASQHGLELKEYPPARVKQSVAGNGRASKEQMQHMVKTLFALKTLPPPDSADALALGLCYFHSTLSEKLKEGKLVRLS